MVQEINEIWICPVCGNRVEVATVGGGPLVCCGQSMQKPIANHDDTADLEKHVPVIEKIEGKGYLVKVGNQPHPMTPEHHIEWVELLLGERAVARFNFKQGDPPEHLFTVQLFEPGLALSARCYCNLHGLWET